MKYTQIQIDKVTYVVSASLVLLPILVYYVWSTLSELLQNPVSTWQILVISISALIGLFVGWLVNPMIAYKRNESICVGGIPFPVHYGIPVDDGCISGYVQYRNYVLDIIYYGLTFISMGLFIYSIGAQHGFIMSLITFSFLTVGIKVFMLDILKIYPLKIETE